MSKQPEMVIARNPRATRNNDTTLNLDNQMYQQPVTSFQRVSNDAPLSEETKTAIQNTVLQFYVHSPAAGRKPRALPPAMSVFPKKISWTDESNSISKSEADFGKVLPGSRLYRHPPLRRGRRIFGNQLQPARIPADACRHQGGQDQARCR